MSIRKSGASISRRRTDLGKAEDSLTTPEGGDGNADSPGGRRGMHSANAAGVAPSAAPLSYSPKALEAPPRRRGGRGARPRVATP